MNLKSLGRVSFSLPFLLLLLASAPPAPAKESWPSIPPEDLALKDNPASPGSPAMILEREDFSDQSNFGGSYETIFYRIKIFTDQGKKYADVEIPFFKNGERIKDIHARTVHPDGKEFEFNGQVFEKTLVKFHDVNYRAKYFTLPDVQPGSIIEYKYRIEWDDPILALILGNHWTLQEDLFMRHAVFSLKKSPILALRWTGRVMHGEQMKEDHGASRFEVVDVPAFEKEDYSPPEEVLKPHLDFYYTEHSTETADQFWQRIGKERYEEVDTFLKKHKAADQIASQTISPADSPETKLRKLYARAQQIRNLSFEREKTKQEEKREKLKENNNVDEILKRGYGDAIDIDYVFADLARAAGFDASIVNVSLRNRYFFSKELLNANQLDDTVVLVRLGKEELYLDPGMRLCPFGLLPWGESASTGIRLDKNGGAFVQTWIPKESDAVTERKATLRLDPDGTLQGKIAVTFSGLEALTRRLDELEQDDISRRKYLQDDSQNWFPPGAAFELTNVTGWENPDEPLRVEGELRVPNFATAAGRRLLLPVAVFRDSLPRTFMQSTRNFPVYFQYPFMRHDDVTIQLPDGIKVENLPSSEQTPPSSVVQYKLVAEQRGASLHFERLLGVNGIFFPVNQYPPLRNFFNDVRTRDDQQTILHSTQVAQPN
jgi:uncharacterized protein DUF3857